MKMTNKTLLLICLSLIGFALNINVFAQDKKVTEPETIGVLYLLDSNATNSLISLERQVAQGTSGGFFKVTIAAEVDGKKSNVRLKADQKPEFVVSLPNGVDPNKFKLYLFGIKKGKRQIIIKEARAFGGVTEPGTILFDIGKYGTSSYKFVPSQSLPPGEYGFSANDSNVVFCFGIDEESSNQQK
jgi:hypothetical protein